MVGKRVRPSSDDGGAGQVLRAEKDGDKETRMPGSEDRVAMLRGQMNDLGASVAQTSSNHHLMEGSCKCSDRTAKKGSHTRWRQQGSGVERMDE